MLTVLKNTHTGKQFTHKPVSPLKITCQNTVHLLPQISHFQPLYYFQALYHNAGV